MLHFPHTSTQLPARRGELPKRKEDPRLQLPACRNKLKGITRVAVVGGGLAGLMAARRLVQFGVKVTVYEARKEVGGRVLSNRTFSNGRITEEGAELIGSFHTKWLELAHEFGLSMISRMDPDLYERAGLDVQLILQNRLSRGEFKKLTNEMYTRVLTPLSLMAAREIKHQDQPWLQSELQKYDNMSVQEALPKFCQISERNKNPADEPLWQMLEFKLVNDEVARLDEMNFLGLLCKIRGGQGERMNPDLPRLTDGYWDELEIFRCAEGCQTLATELAKKIETKKYGPEPATVRRLVAVTHINISTTGVTLGLKATRPDGKFVDDKPPSIIPGFSYVILAIPPSVWSRVKITANGQDADPAKWTGGMQMNGAVKHFSDVKERFWVRKKAAPYGGALRMGQVWEGTDNQTRVGKQGIVLSVFAGPVSASGQAPTREEIRNGLSTLYPDYLANLTKPPLFSDWPNVPFIKTGYWTPAVREIFRVGEKLSKAFHDRLFFAGEHTQMDFFGYMEGALRSGERAAETLALTACDLLKDPGPKAPSPPILTRATPTRETTAFEREAGKRLEKRSPIVDPEEAGSPFMHQELFVMKPEEKLERRAAALVSESPFVGAIEEHTSSFDYDQLKDHGALDELEAETDWETKEVWDELEEGQLAPQADQTEDEYLDYEDALLREDETKFEKPEGFAAGESQLEWLHEDLSDDLSLEKEQEWGRSEIEGEDFSDVSFEEEGSSKRIPISRSKASFSQVSMASSVVDPFPRPIIMPLDMTVSLSRDNSKVEFGKCIEDASRPADVSGLCGAVIDLTGDPDLPPYVGHNDTDMLYVGSLAKIYPLLAAFELRRRVTRQAKDMIRIGLSTATAGWQNKVFAELKKGWQPKLDAAFKNPKLPSGFPDLAKVVEISPDGAAKLRQEFLGWIRAALGQNDETAVGKYIRALSYPYINGVLAAAGFFKPADKKGLWISGDYNGNDWKTADGAGMPLTARWQLPGHPVSNFTGTALQVVRFLGLMAQGKLVDPDSSREMIDLLGIPFLHKTLTDATPSPRPFTSALGKVGIGTWDGRYHDSAIVRIERGGDPARRIRYALAVLGSPNGTARLRKLELAYHDCVVARHP
jgi:monoamine oxidase